MTASTYGRLTPRMAWQLAAPHTWPAAILPVLVAAAAAAVTSFSISATMVCVLLVICVLMQSAVNTFNDYYDYVKGADSADDNVDPTDAVLVYNNVNPRAALALAVGFLAAAFLLGAYVIWIAGWIPLAIGAAGAVVVVLYSAGKTPISYLPIGELVSGFVMGGLIRWRATRRFPARSTSVRSCGPCPPSWAWGSSCSRTTPATWKDVRIRAPATLSKECCTKDPEAQAHEAITASCTPGWPPSSCSWLRSSRSRLLSSAVHAAVKLSLLLRAAEGSRWRRNPHRRHGAGV